MGYSYTMDGRLCCDACDEAGGVRRYRCPFNWCGPVALCPACAKGKYRLTLHRAFHVERGCQRQSEEYHASRRAQEAPAQ